MNTIDWIVLAGTLGFIVFYGWWKTRRNNGDQEYLQGKGSSSWWVVGLSVMATQASAITFLSTPGQAYHDGLGFVQFYFGLPIAMVIISILFIPIFRSARIRTAYELLEKRFDLKTRTLTASLFLIQRGLSAGITIFAPSIILSAILGWDLRLLNVIIGVLVMLYTVTGGTKAVNVTQTQQMFVILLGLVFTFFFLLGAFPDGLGLGEVTRLAGRQGKMKILDFSLDPANRYTFWSGITGGLFLALSYFGTDQSQVQRYLSARSERESRWGLLFNAALKIPLQFFILFIGVLVFMFYQFHPTPLHFNPATTQAMREGPEGITFQKLEERHAYFNSEKTERFKEYTELIASSEARQAQEAQIRMDELEREIDRLDRLEAVGRRTAAELIRDTDQSLEVNDKDYVFITFVLDHLPIGLVGLLLAVILSAAMSSTASELNALGTTSAIDFYSSYIRKDPSPDQLSRASRRFTLMWGVIAIGIASVANLFDNLIQLVNIIGSLFYGNVLGIFLLAFVPKGKSTFPARVSGTSVFVGALITQIIVLVVYFLGEGLSYLWLNLIGCVSVMGLAYLLEILFFGEKERS